VVAERGTAGAIFVFRILTVSQWSDRYMYAELQEASPVRSLCERTRSIGVKIEATTGLDMGYIPRIWY
jgi:hypothetical protein